MIGAMFDIYGVCADTGDTGIQRTYFIIGSQTAVIMFKINKKHL